MNAFAQRLATIVGAELRALRLRAGLTQERVAQLTGSHRPIIARTEAGRHVPKLDLIALQAEVCGGSILDVTRAMDRELYTRARAA